MRQPDDASRLARLLWEVGAHSSSLSDSALTDLSLTAASVGVLDAIAANPGTSAAELTRRFPTTQQAVSQIVSRLRKLGYLERRIRPSGRGIALFLTPAGVEAQRRADALLRAVDGEFVAALGSEQHHQLVLLLSQARATFERVRLSASREKTSRRSMEAPSADVGFVAGQAAQAHSHTNQGDSR